MIFFVGAIVVIAATIPYEQVSVDESPFVTVFSMLGIPYAADIMNFVIITALLSAGNCGLFSCARMLFSLADEGHAPKAFRKLTKRGIPMVALCVSMLGGLASLISSVVAPATVYLVLVSVAGFATVGVWMSIVASHFIYRRTFIKNGGDLSTLPYKAPAVPAGTDPRVRALLGVADRHRVRPQPGSGTLVRRSVRGRLLRHLLLQIRAAPVAQEGRGRLGLFGSRVPDLLWRQISPWATFPGCPRADSVSKGVKDPSRPGLRQDPCRAATTHIGYPGNLPDTPAKGCVRELAPPK